MKQRKIPAGDKHRRNTGKLRPPWKPGQSGNPMGRPPKHECLTSLLKEELDRIGPGDKRGRTWRELIVLATLELARKGHPVALREIWQRADGRLPQAIEHSKLGKTPFTFTLELGNDERNERG